MKFEKLTRFLNRQVERVRPQEKQAGYSNTSPAKYLGIYDPEQLSSEQRAWMQQHAGEMVNLPLIQNPDGTYSIKTPSR